MDHKVTLKLNGYKGSQPVTLPIREFFAIEGDVVTNTKAIEFAECKSGHAVVNAMTISVSGGDGVEIDNFYMDVAPLKVFGGVTPYFNQGSIRISQRNPLMDVLK